jgi:hypothetical protein
VTDVKIRMKERTTATVGVSTSSCRNQGCDDGLCFCMGRTNVRAGHLSLTRLNAAAGVVERSRFKRKTLTQFLVRFQVAGCSAAVSEAFVQLQQLSFDR